MSASTSTVQQPLGTGQFWAALAVVTMALIAAIVIAFGSVGATKPAAGTSPLSVGVPPDARIHQVSNGTSSGISVGVPPDAQVHQVSNGASSGISVGVPPDAIPHRAVVPTARRHFPR